MVLADVWVLVAKFLRGNSKEETNLDGVGAYYLMALTMLGGLKEVWHMVMVLEMHIQIIKESKLDFTKNANSKKMQNLIKMLRLQNHFHFVKLDWKSQPRRRKSQENQVYLV